MEEWRTIPNFEGIYEASSLGRVRTTEDKITHTDRHGIRHWKQRVLKQKWQTKKGGRKDARVDLWRNGTHKTILVARCVCAAFHPNPDMDKLTVNHINGNPTDNRAENLEWVTMKENIEHAWVNGLMPSEKSVVLRDINGDRKRFRSYAAAGRFLGRNNGYISGCIAYGRQYVNAVTGERYEIEVAVTKARFPDAT